MFLFLEINQFLVDQKIEYQCQGIRAQFADEPGMNRISLQVPLELPVSLQPICAAAGKDGD